MYNNYMELHKAVKFKKSVEKESQGAVVFETKAKDEGIDFHDKRSVQKIKKTRSHVRLGLSAVHLKSPTSALAAALRRTEDAAGRAQSSSAG